MMIELFSIILSLDIFIPILALSAIYALIFGGVPERLAVLIFLFAITTSIYSSSPRAIRFHSVEIGVFYTDLIMLIMLAALMLHADRYWTIWLCSLQLIQVLSHLPKLFIPDLIPQAYYVAVSVWSYPMIALLAIGTWRHRERVRKIGADRPWSSFSV